MKKKKIILVTGATGAQGGSVARTLLQQGKFDVRILTRDGKSPRAIALEQAGAEIAIGDFDDVESLRDAMRDVYGVFGVTDFEEHAEREIFHGKNLVDTVNYAGVEHFVYSASPNYHKLSNGYRSVPQHDIKARLQEYTKSLNIPSTFVHVAFYFENFINLFPLQRDKQNNLHFSFPQGDAKLAMASVTDLGGVVATILDHPVEYRGRTVGIVAEDRTCADYANIMSKILNQNVYYHHVPRDIFIGFDFPQAEIWADAFEVQRQFVMNHQLDLIESYGLNPAMQTFETWLQKNKEKILSRIPQEEDAVLV